MGGVLATLPTTIVPASLGIANQTMVHEQFLTAMVAVPFGMALNAGFLGLWQWIPNWLPPRPAALRFPLTLTLSLCFARARGVSRLRSCARGRKEGTVN